MENRTAGKPARVRWRTGAVLLAAVAVGAFFGYSQWSRWKTDSLLAAAEKSLEQDRPGEALRLSREAISWNPQSPKGWLIVCRSQLALKDYAAGLESLQRVPLADSPRVLEAYNEAARALVFHLNQPSRAELMYRNVLKISPNHRAAVEGMADLLGLSARRWEAIPYLVDLVRLGHFRVEHLTLLGTENGAHPSPDLWKQWLEQQPDEPLGHLAWAWHTADGGNRDEVIEHLRKAIGVNPQLVEAHALLGSLLMKGGRLDEMHDWHAKLPRMAEAHPVIWTVRAQWAQQCGGTASAIRCYAEAIQRNPNLRDANYQIGQLLHTLDEPLLAAPFLKRSQQLQELSARESVLLHSEHTSLAPIRRFADQLLVLGRLWEAWGWSRIAQQIDTREKWPGEMQTELAKTLSANPPWTLEGVNPVNDFEIEKYPLPNWSSLVAPATDVSPAPASSASSASADVPIRFEESAAQAGLDFQYFNSGDPETPGQYMYEFTGGGVAVLDFDGDHWPDVYLTQGCRWPPRAKQTEHLDQLFRNAEGGRFQNVTAGAALSEDQFSQGVAAGDVNNDGFPDLLVGNIGHNRLLINNGDGTFDETRLPNDPGRWTTSCAIADVNGDSWPDIYAANYVVARDVFTRMCQHKDGVPRMCAPFDFAGSPDEFYLNLGDGTFVEASHLAGLTDENGKGLGVVVADLDGGGQLDLFVANDLVENFYFVNQTSKRGGPPRFSEQAVPLGMAYGVEGRAQGCMGIAVGDADGDRLLDVFVTNFLMEPNAFYVQLSEGFFSDEIHRTGLYDTSMQQLGFGTQFIDGDLDGRLDLIVTNGHIDDHRNYGRAYHMPPQFFRNVGEGKFRESAPSTLGPFFGGAYLGRGLAKCDWNRDGAEDVIISHLDSPAALLTNTTPARGRFVAIHLRGTTSARDAIGTSLRLKIGDEVLYRQLTAGDGYQASNEHVVIFGLGNDAVPEELEVQWPSGQVDRITDIPINRSLLLIEGNAELQPYL